MADGDDEPIQPVLPEFEPVPPAKPKSRRGGPRANSGGARKNAGRKKFKPTDEQRRAVQVLRANGNTNRIIALVMGITEQSLERHYHRDLANAFDEVKARISTAVVRSALGGNVAAQKYWLFCKGGPEWRPPRDDETYANGGGTTILIRGGLPQVIDAKPEPNGEDHGSEPSSDHREPDGADPPAE
jgi:hypothetical protein